MRMLHSSSTDLSGTDDVLTAVPRAVAQFLNCKYVEPPAKNTSVAVVEEEDFVIVRISRVVASQLKTSYLEIPKKTSPHHSVASYEQPQVCHVKFDFLCPSFFLLIRSRQEKFRIHLLGLASHPILLVNHRIAVMLIFLTATLPTQLPDVSPFLFKFLR